MPLRADRRRALAANAGLSTPSEFSGTIRSTSTIQEGTEKRGLYPRYVSVRVSRIPRVPPTPPTTFEMRYGLLKSAVRLQLATEQSAPSARSRTYLRMQAHTTDTAFATAIKSGMTPLSHHSGVPHRTHTPSHRPSDCRAATAAGPITLAVVPGSRFWPACNKPLRAHRRRALAANAGLSAPAELSRSVRITNNAPEGTETSGLLFWRVSVFDSSARRFSLFLR